MTNKRYLNAAVLEKIKKPLKIINKIEIPKLKHGQVLVKLKYSGICYSQIMEIDGLRGKDKYLPHMLGHEGIGRVVSKHISVKKIKVNDLVILTWIKSKGINSQPPIFKKGKKIINAGQITTFSNYTIVSENRVIKKPRGLNIKEAVLYGCAVPTGTGMVVKQAKLKNNEFLAISGIGGVGLISLLTSKALNHKKIIAIDIDEKKLNLAKKIGIKHTINPSKENLLNKIKNITNAEMIHISLDCSGNINSIENSFKILNAQKGKCIFCSHPSHNKKIKIDPFELIKGKKIEGSWGGNVKPDIDLEKFHRLLKKNNINLLNFISKEYSFEKINKAISDFKKRKILRPIIKF